MQTIANLYYPMNLLCWNVSIILLYSFFTCFQILISLFKCIMYSVSPFKGKSQQSMWWQVPAEGRCRLADTECLGYFQTYVPQSHFSTADRSIGLHNKNVLLVKMITSCEQNYSITPCDWCLDISQITTLHKPWMIHKNQWLLAEQYFTKVTGNRQCNAILSNLCGTTDDIIAVFLGIHGS